MRMIAADNLSMVQYAEALALDWHVMFSPNRFVYEARLTRSCVHQAGQDTCGECRITRVRDRKFVPKHEFLGQLAIPNIFGGTG